MGKTLSPLRYPGGKSQTIRSVQRLIEKNEFGRRLYVEPFAGGFGVGIALLVNNVIDQAIINDLDHHVYHFWHSVLYHTNDMIELVNKTEITLEERQNQKEIYNDVTSTPVQDGFATLFLNRVNYSGVLFAGPIGGKGQLSAYSLDCRFNKKDIIKRIQIVSQLRERIRLYNLDACELITHELAADNAHAFYNIDPPYVKKGKSLYTEYFTEQNHREFGAVVRDNLANVPWIITYDNCPLVREIYRDYLIKEFELYHSAHDRTVGAELIISNISEKMFIW